MNLQDQLEDYNVRIKWYQDNTNWADKDASQSHNEYITKLEAHKEDLIKEIEVENAPNNNKLL